MHRIQGGVSSIVQLVLQVLACTIIVLSDSTAGCHDSKYRGLQPRLVVKLCCREVWSSGPSSAALAARAVWKQLSLAESVSWTQSSSDLELRLLLPAGERVEGWAPGLHLWRVLCALFSRWFAAAYLFL